MNGYELGFNPDIIGWFSVVCTLIVLAILPIKMIIDVHEKNRIKNSQQDQKIAEMERKFVTDIVNMASDAAIGKIMQMMRQDPIAYSNLSVKIILAGDSTEQTKGYVYLAKGLQHYKIGKTGDPNGRLETLNRQSEAKIEFIHLIPCENMHIAESYFHGLFKPKRRNGEWFDLSGDDIIWLKGVAGMDVNQRPLPIKK